MDLENLKNEIDTIFASKSTIDVYDYVHLSKQRKRFVDLAIEQGLVLCTKKYSYMRKFYR